MCGIIGYVGMRRCAPLLMQGLTQLESRGYDSAGVTLAESGGLRSLRAMGPLDNLRPVVDRHASASSHGVGHTRWATHGTVTLENAHPLTGCEENEIAIVLNGIVENHSHLRESLLLEGHTFTSGTDAEVVAHLVERSYAGDLEAAVAAVVPELEGHYAFVVIHRDHPDELVATRHECPLVIGVGIDEHFIASNAAAFVGETGTVLYPENGEIIVVTPEKVTFRRDDGTAVERLPSELAWSGEAIDKGDYESFMLKEIYEQPDAVANTIAGRTNDGTVTLEPYGLSDEDIRRLRRVVIVSAGTSYHAGLLGRYAIEEWAELTVEADIASEWLYRNMVFDPETLVIAVSQSGETRDTIAAVQLARQRGARTLAITNTPGSQITREVDATLFTHAGPEVSVAASKTFTAQAALFALLALDLARARHTMPPAEIAALVDEITALPRKMSAFLDGDHPIDEIASEHVDKSFFLYIGRHAGLPVALEGALKLKEISYIPTDAYAAGEMKHGPIALLDEATPVIAIATDSHVYSKIVSNIQETRARGAQVVGIASDGNESIQHLVEDVIYVPVAHPLLQPLLAILPLQLLAYRIATLRGLNVDQPRNLAKTVTVE
jgi:glucosamine--fructose-6-phosphate aminotransferase (isomerizing)